MLLANRTIAICGSTPFDPAETETARVCGRMLAEEGADLIYGAGQGTPCDLVQAFLDYSSGVTQEVIGLSPWSTQAKHDAAGFHRPAGVRMEYTGWGPGRNSPLVERSDALIAFGGRYGTLSDLAFAGQFRRPILVYTPVSRQGTRDESACAKFARLSRDLPVDAGSDRPEVPMVICFGDLDRSIRVALAELARLPKPPPAMVW